MSLSKCENSQAFGVAMATISAEIKRLAQVCKASLASSTQAGCIRLNPESELAFD